MPNKFYFYLIAGADCYIENNHGCFLGRNAPGLHQECDSDPGGAGARFASLPAHQCLAPQQKPAENFGLPYGED